MSDSSKNVLWLSKLAVKELRSYIAVNLPNLFVSTLEVDIGQTPVFETLDSIMLMQFGSCGKG